MDPPPAPAADLLALDKYAAITVDVVDAGTPLPRALEKHGVAERAWEVARVVWARRLSDEATEGGPTPLGDAFATALAAARVALIPMPELTVEEWAELAHAAAERGVAAALAPRGLAPATYLRLAQHWAERLAGDPALTLRYSKAFSRAAKGAAR